MVTHATPGNVGGQNRECKGPAQALVVNELVSAHVVCRATFAGGVFRFAAWPRLAFDLARARGEWLPDPFVRGEGCGLPYLPPAPLDYLPRVYRDALAAFFAELSRHVADATPRAGPLPLAVVTGETRPL